MATNKDTLLHPYNADGSVNEDVNIYPKTRESAMLENDGTSQYKPAKVLFQGDTVVVERSSGITQEGITWNDIKKYNLITLTFSDGDPNDQSFANVTFDPKAVEQFTEGITVPMAVSKDLNSGFHVYMITIYKQNGWWSFHMKTGEDTFQYLYLKKVTGVK